MRRLAAGIAVGAAVAGSGLIALVACSSGDTQVPPAGDVDAADGPAVEASTSDVRPIPQGYDGGLGIGLVDVPDTPCSPRGGPSVVIAASSAPDAGAPAYRSLHAAGARWVASSSDGATVATFAKDGTAIAIAPPGTVSGGEVTAIGSQSYLAGTVAFTSVVAQPLDPNGAATGDPITIGNEDPEGLAVGASDTTALIAWGTPTGIRARGFTLTEGAIGAGPFDLAVTKDVDEPTIAVAYWDQGLFGVVFSGGQGRYLTAFGRGRAGTRTDDPHELFTGEIARRVIGLTRAPNGYALLVEVDAPKPYAMLMLLDVGGRPLTAGLKLVGTAGASAIALNGSELGVLAVRPQAQGASELLATEFRPFSAVTGDPLGPWVCLDDPGPQIDLAGGLAADGTGYASIYKAKDGSTSFARFDRLGTGAP